MKTLVTSLEDLKGVAKNILAMRTGRDLILLRGPLGVGKTQFVKLCLELLGGQPEEGHSPTFSIHNEYWIQSECVDHLDLYRLNTEAEIENIGFWDLFSKTKGLIFIEWAERLDLSRLPHTWKIQNILITFDLKNPSCRWIEF